MGQSEGLGAVVAPREEGGHDGMSWRNEGSSERHWKSVFFAVNMGVLPPSVSLTSPPVLFCASVHLDKR